MSYHEEYDAYVAQCEELGIDPLTYAEWWNS